MATDARVDGASGAGTGQLARLSTETKRRTGPIETIFRVAATTSEKQSKPRGGQK
jgi:hypothetical protein